jgi:uncharacterized protein
MKTTLSLDNARQWYPIFDAVHGFDHIERVYHLCEKIGAAEGADMGIVLTAVLLHDSQGSTPGGEERPNHHIASAEFAGKVLTDEGWLPERIQAVQHCIRAHRFRRNGEEPTTLEAKVLFDADKLDVLGAIGVARTLGYAIKIGTLFFSEPSEKFLTTGQEMAGETHSAYHEYLYKLCKISNLLYTTTARHLAEGRQRFLNQFFDELMAECRGVS